MVARALPQAADPFSGRGPALDRRLDPGVPRAFHPGSPSRPNPHGAHLPPRIQTPLAGTGPSNDSGTQSADAAASGAVDAKRCKRNVAGVVGRANLPAY